VCVQVMWALFAPALTDALLRLRHTQSRASPGLGMDLWALPSPAQWPLGGRHSSVHHRHGGHRVTPSPLCWRPGGLAWAAAAAARCPGRWLACSPAAAAGAAGHVWCQGISGAQISGWCCMTSVEHMYQLQVLQRTCGVRAYVVHKEAVGAI